MKVLIFAAHPDDCEIGMGGSIKKMTASNYDVTVIDLTQGEMSSNGNILQRQKEARLASQMLGIKNRKNLLLADRNIEGHLENIKKIANEIRLYRPDIIFYPNHEDKHPDHRACSALIKESIFHAKLQKFTSIYDAFSVKKSFRYQINGRADFDYFIDITDTYEDKFLALKAYESQFNRMGNESNTRLNSGFLSYLESINRMYGFECGVEYAEGFITDTPLVFDTVENLEAIL